MDSPSHWSTVSEVTEEIYTVKNLAASSTVIFVVRARNHHGLSPPSPMSKPMKTSAGTTFTEDGSLSSLGGLPSSTEPDLATVRLRLSQRIVELKEALVAGSRKVKLLWEVNQFFSDISAIDTFNHLFIKICCISVVELFIRDFGGRDLLN